MIKFNSVMPTLVVSSAIDHEPPLVERPGSLMVEHERAEYVEAEPSEEVPFQEEDGSLPVGAEPGTERSYALMEGSKNLLKHIPGEASGFYLMAVDAIPNPGLGSIGFIFVLALILLILVRYLAGASLGIMVSTILAFLIWMLVLDSGLFHVAFPNLLPDPFGLIVAFFYSMVVTLLASAGKIQ